MRIDFFNTPCAEGPRNDKRYGICDEQDGSKAFTDIDREENWIASVLNENSREVVFTAIDNCFKITKPGTNDFESTCDGMLTFDDSLFFVELKNKKEQWIPEAKQQLENTIRLFLQHHQDSGVRFRKAFACNKRHPFFHTVENEDQKRFFDEYGFRFDINSRIVIK